MLPKDFEGNTPTIKDVFHTLETRLSFIMAGIAKYRKYYDGKDYECNPQEAMFEIQSRVYGYHSELVFGEIVDILELIHRIQVAIDELPQEEERDTSHEWFVPIDNTMKFIEELDIYKVFLEGIQESPLFHQNSSVTNLDSSLNKIKINITVEQLGALIYFLNDENHFIGNVRIFQTDFKKLCKVFRAIFIKPDGSDFAEESLYNEVSGFKKNKNKIAINFWKDKFIKYMNQSNILLTQVDEPSKTRVKNKL